MIDSNDPKPKTDKQRISLLTVLMACVAVFALYYFPLGDGMTATLAEASLTTSFIRVCVASAALWLMLRSLDYTGGINFGKEWDGLGLPHAIYLTGRFFGVCWLLGCILR